MIVRQYILPRGFFPRLQELLPDITPDDLAGNVVMEDGSRVLGLSRSEAGHKKVEEALAQVRADLEEEPSLKAYSLRGLPVSAKKAYEVIDCICAGNKPVDKVRVMLDVSSSMLLVNGRKSVQEKVSDLLSQLRTLEEAKESAVAEDKLMLRIYTPPLSVLTASDLVEGLAWSPDAVVGVVFVDERLIFWGLKADHEKVRVLFEQIAQEIQQMKKE